MNKNLMVQNYTAVRSDIQQTLLLLLLTQHRGDSEISHNRVCPKVRMMVVPMVLTVTACSRDGYNEWQHEECKRGDAGGQVVDFVFVLLHCHQQEECNCNNGVSDSKLMICNHPFSQYQYLICKTFEPEKTHQLHQSGVVSIIHKYINKTVQKQ